MARTYNGTSDILLVSQGGTNFSSSAAGATMAAIVRRNSTGWNSVIGARASGGAIQGWSMEIENSAGGNNITFDANVGGGFGATTTITCVNADGWVLLVASRASGATGNARFYKYQYSNATPTFETVTGFTSAGSAPGASSTVEVGGRWGSTGTDWFGGDIACAAVWNRQLSDVEMANLAHTLQAWHASGPAALWLLDQGATTQKVIDLTGGGANESSLTGTSVSSNSAPFAYSDGIWLPTHQFGGNVSVSPTIGALTLAADPPVPSGGTISVSPTIGALTLSASAPTVQTTVFTVTKVCEETHTDNVGQTFTLTANVPAGNTLLLCHTDTVSHSHITSVTDPHGNTWSNDFVQVNTTGFTTEVWRAYATTGYSSGDTISVGFTPVTNESSVMCILSVSGITSSSPLDQAAGTNITLATAHSSPTVTTTVASELLVGVFGLEYIASPFWTPGAGWTEVMDLSVLNNINRGQAVQYREVSATGSYAASGTSSAAKNSADVIVTYKSASGDISVSPTIGAVTLSAAAPSVTLTGSVAATVGTVTLSAVAPAVSMGETINAAVGVLTLDGVAPSFSSGMTVNHTIGQVVLSAGAPSFFEGLDTTAGVLTLGADAAQVTGVVAGNDVPMRTMMRVGV